MQTKNRMDHDEEPVNENILAPKVLVINKDGEKLGVMPTKKAIEMAFEDELDLVAVALNADPPVCRIMDHGKYKFEQNKKKHAAKKNQKQVHLKEIKFRPGTEEGDYQVKLRNLTRFLNDGDRTKVTLRFRGRELAHREVGMKMLERLETDLADISSVEQRPQMEGRQMIMILVPKKK